MGRTKVGAPGAALRLGGRGLALALTLTLAAATAPSRVAAGPGQSSNAQQCWALDEAGRAPHVAWLRQCLHALTPSSDGTYRTIGRFLLDPEGALVVPRGAEQVFWDAPWLLPSFVTEIGRSGANVVRVLPYYQLDPPTGEPRSTLEQIEEMIRRGIDSHMLVDVAIDEGRDPSVYLRPEVRELLGRYEKYIVLHAKGGGDESTDEEWVANATSVIAALRDAGYQEPLYIMSRVGGRSLPTLLAHGQTVLDADPLHNVVFGWQARWGTDNHYQDEYGMTLAEAMYQVALAPIPIQVGLGYHSDPELNPEATVPYADLMRLAQELSVGWLWWDWRMGVDDLTADGRYLHWAHQGEDVVFSDANSIQRTSVRTSFQLNSVAP